MKICRDIQRFYVVKLCLFDPSFGFELEIAKKVEFKKKEKLIARFTNYWGFGPVFNPTFLNMRQICIYFRFYSIYILNLNLKMWGASKKKTENSDNKLF